MLVKVSCVSFKKMLCLESLYHQYIDTGLSNLTYISQKFLHGLYGLSSFYFIIFFLLFFFRTTCGKAALARYQSKVQKGIVIDHTKEEKHIKWSKNDEWWAYEGKRIRWVGVLLGANILMAFYGFFKARFESPLMPISYPLAKAGGGILNFNCATILIPVCRNMLSWLRTTPVNDILPLDDNISSCPGKDWLTPVELEERSRLIIRQT